MRHSRKNIIDDFVKGSCFFYSKGVCSILTGFQIEKGSPIKRKCSPIAICEMGKDIKTFITKIKVDGNENQETSIPLSRYLE